MVLSALAGMALAMYTARTALGIYSDKDTRQVISKLRTSVSEALSEARQGVVEASAKARTRRELDQITQQSSLLMSRVFGSATEEERQTLTELFVKYGSE